MQNLPYFHLEGTLLCGQAFRWEKRGQAFFGVAGGRALTINRVGEDVLLSGCTRQDYDQFWQHYFDLAFDYDGLIHRFRHDPWIEKGVAYAYGVRRLNQPPFETLLSFIISANNNVGRISGIIRRMSERWGGKLADGVYAFPTPEQLRQVTAEDYAQIGAGYRAKYLESAVSAILHGFSLENLQSLDYPAAKKEIMTISGVGPKVADCVLLYGLGFNQAFPADVWVKRVMTRLYGVTHAKNIAPFVEEHFGQDAGVLQTILFHYARNCLD